MKKVMKYLLMTMISIVIAGICLFFPSELSKWKDKQAIGSVSLEKIEETKIEHSQQMTMLEKLRLFNDKHDTLDTISINQGKYLKEEDLWEVSKREVGSFQEMGLLKNVFIDSGADSMETTLNFYISTEEPTKSMIVWTVIITNQKGALAINLDDETGKILSFTLKYVEDFTENLEFMEDTDEFVSQLSEYYGINVVGIKQIDQSRINKIDNIKKGIQVDFVVEEENKQFHCYAYMNLSRYDFGFDYALDKTMGTSKE